jgi:hypothetical protein
MGAWVAWVDLICNAQLSESALLRPWAGCTRSLILNMPEAPRVGPTRPSHPPARRGCPYATPPPPQPPLPAWLNVCPRWTRPTAKATAVPAYVRPREPVPEGNPAHMRWLPYVVARPSKVATSSSPPSPHLQAPAVPVLLNHAPLLPVAPPAQQRLTTCAQQPIAPFQAGSPRHTELVI